MTTSLHDHRGMVRAAHRRVRRLHRAHRSAWIRHTTMVGPLWALLQVSQRLLAARMIAEEKAKRGPVLFFIDEASAWDEANS